MKKWLIACISILLIITGIIVYNLQTPKSVEIELLTLSDGSAIQLIKQKKPQKRVLIVTTPKTTLSREQLLQFGNSGNFQIATLILDSKECTKQQNRLAAAIQVLDNVDIIAGIDEGGATALRWLASQNNDQATALSVGFSVEKMDCPKPLPNKITHGHWLVAWNDHPDNPTVSYTQQQTNTQTLIGNYDHSLQELLVTQLNRLLHGNTNHLPLIEIKAVGTAKDTAIIFYSGDGGWRDLDRDVGQQLANLGYPVIGVDTLRYYWQRKEPSQAAADLASIMDKYKKQWSIKYFVLVGFSFGADVMPALYNRLNPEEQQQIIAVQLLAFSRGVNYEIKVAGWVTNTKTEALTGPEVAKIPKQKLLCIIGEEEAKDSGCVLPSMHGTLIILLGGHHFDKDYPALAARLVKHFTANLQPSNT